MALRRAEVDDKALGTTRLPIGFVPARRFAPHPLRACLCFVIEFRRLLVLTGGSLWTNRQNKSMPKGPAAKKDQSPAAAAAAALLSPGDPAGGAARLVPPARLIVWSKCGLTAAHCTDKC